MDRRAERRKKKKRIWHCLSCASLAAPGHPGAPLANPLYRHAATTRRHTTAARALSVCVSGGDEQGLALACTLAACARFFAVEDNNHIVLDGTFRLFSYGQGPSELLTPSIWYILSPAHYSPTWISSLPRFATFTPHTCLLPPHPPFSLHTLHATHTQHTHTLAHTHPHMPGMERQCPHSGSVAQQLPFPRMTDYGLTLDRQTTLPGIPLATYLHHPHGIMDHYYGPFPRAGPAWRFSPRGCIQCNRPLCPWFCCHPPEGDNRREAKEEEGEKEAGGILGRHKRLAAWRAGTSWAVKALTANVLWAGIPAFFAGEYQWMGGQGPLHMGVPTSLFYSTRRDARLRCAALLLSRTALGASIICAAVGLDAAFLHTICGHTFPSWAAG